jgi:hypothetical protein
MHPLLLRECRRSRPPDVGKRHLSRACHAAPAIYFTPEPPTQEAAARPLGAAAPDGGRRRDGGGQARGRGCGEKREAECVVRRRAAALDDPGTLFGGDGGVVGGYVTIGDLVAAMEEARSAIAGLG